MALPVLRVTTLIFPYVDHCFTVAHLRQVCCLWLTSQPIPPPPLPWFHNLTSTPPPTSINTHRPPFPVCIPDVIHSHTTTLSSPLHHPSSSPSCWPVLQLSQSIITSITSPPRCSATATTTALPTKVAALFPINCIIALSTFVFTHYNNFYSNL